MIPRSERFLVINESENNSATCIFFLQRFNPNIFSKKMKKGIEQVQCLMHVQYCTCTLKTHEWSERGIFDLH